MTTPHTNEIYKHPYQAVLKRQAIWGSKGKAPIGTVVKITGRFTDAQGEWYKAMTADGNRLQIRLEDFN